MKNSLLLPLLAAAVAVCACSSLGLGGGSSSSSAGGNRTENLTASSQLPAAEGQVKFAPTKNGNTSVDVSVKHLAHPERLNPPASTYVVWIQRAADAAPQNIGALKVDDQLNGELRTVTPLGAFDLFVTA